MPVYEYQCLDNGHRFDLYQAVGAPPPGCPVCGSATRKVYTSVGLIFKGSGFHVTDYRRPSDGRSADGADGKAGEKSEEKAAAGGESKDPSTSSSAGDGKKSTPSPAT